MKLSQIRKATPIIALALMAVAAIMLLKSQKTAVKPRPRPTPPQLNYGILIQTHTDQASRRNLNALKSFEMDINRLVKGHELKLQEAATAASLKAADYKSCCAIVYYLAWDKARNENRTDTYLDAQIQPITKPAIDALAKDVNAAIGRLDAGLKSSTLKLAKDLAALGRGVKQDPPTVQPHDLDRRCLFSSLRNLGLNATGLSVALAFDAAAILKSKTASLLWKKIVTIAARMFGKQVAKVGGSAVAAAVDGPLPIGDIIALGGLMWTGYDIIAGQEDFEKEVSVSVNNMLASASDSVHKQAFNHANAMLEKYQAVQDSIGSEMAAELSVGTP